MRKLALLVHCLGHSSYPEFQQLPRRFLPNDSSDKTHEGSYQ